MERRLLGQAAVLLAHVRRVNVEGNDRVRSVANMLHCAGVDVQSLHLVAVPNPEDELSRLLTFFQVQVYPLHHLCVAYHAISVRESVHLHYWIRLLVLGDRAETNLAAFHLLLHLFNKFFGFLHIKLGAVEIMREAKAL